MTWREKAEAYQYAIEVIKHNSLNSVLIEGHNGRNSFDNALHNMERAKFLVDDMAHQMEVYNHLADEEDAKEPAEEANG